MRKHTKIFNDITELAGEINKTLHDDYDFPIAITGVTGSGKSNFSIQLGKSLAELNGNHFDFESNVCFTRKNIEENIKKHAPRYSLISGDEMINAMFKRDFANRKQISLIKLFNMCRYKNLAIAFVIPRFWSLDKEVRQNYIKMWVSIKRRGHAIIYIPDLEDDFSDDVWHKSENSKLVGHNKLHKSINYAGEIEFDDFTPEDKEQYIAIKEKKSLKRVGK